MCTLTLNASDLATIVIHRDNLRVSIDDRNDIFVQKHGANNDNLRHAAYRRYILWRFGRLVEGNRVVILSCVVCKIRRLYPSPDGLYRGFRAHQLDMH